jgi:heptosyltransferase I
MRILIVKLSSLGDVVQTMPVVADIHAAIPNAQIDWVVEEAFAPLVMRLVGINSSANIGANIAANGLERVIPCGLRRWRKAGLLGWLSSNIRAERAAFKAQIRAVSYDAVIDCQGLTKSALVARIAQLSPGGVRGSFANQSDACGYEWPVTWLLPNNQAMPKRIHAVARTRLLVAKMLGYEPRTAIWQEPPVVAFKGLPELTDETLRKAVMLTHGTTRADNEWSFQHWFALAQRFMSSGYSIVLPQASDDELAFCNRIKSKLQALAPDEPIHILERMNLSHLLNEMSLCAGVIGVDSGLSHMAVALDLPHVQIFSQDRAWRAGPLPVVAGGVAYQVALGGKYTPDVNEVWEAWQAIEHSQSKRTIKMLGTA